MVEHQFDIIDDATKETAFRHFVQDDQRVLFNGFSIKLEVNAAHNLVFLQRSRAGQSAVRCMVA